jgi:hypothetical protein
MKVYVKIKFERIGNDEGVDEPKERRAHFASLNCAPTCVLIISL